MFAKGIAALSIILAHAIPPCCGDEVAEFLADVRCLQEHFDIWADISVRRIHGNWRFAEIRGYTPFRLAGTDKELIDDAIRGPAIEVAGSERIEKVVAIGHQRMFEFDVSRRIVFQQYANQLTNLEEIRVSDAGMRDNPNDEAMTRQHILSLVNFLSDESFRRLPAGRNLRAMSFANCSVDDSVVAAIANLTSLEELSLEGNEAVTDIGIAKLASLPKLRHLDLHHVGFDGCRALSHMAELRTLHIQELTPTTSQGALGQLNNLRELQIDGATKLPAEKVALPRNLNRLDVREMDLVPIFDFAACSNLAHIDLHLNTAVACAIPTETLEQLGRLPTLTSICLFDASDINAVQLSKFESLRELELVPACGSPLTGDALLAIGAMRGLESINIEVSNLNAKAVDALGELRNLHHLRLLILHPIGERELAGVAQLKSLRSLHLHHSPVTPDDGWAETLFADSSQLLKVSELRLSANLANEQLLGLARFSNLRTLEVNCESEKSDHSFAELMRRLPNLECLVIPARSCRRPLQE